MFTILLESELCKCLGKELGQRLVEKSNKSVNKGKATDELFRPIGTAATFLCASNLLFMPCHRMAFFGAMCYNGGIWMTDYLMKYCVC